MAIISFFYTVWKISYSHELKFKKQLCKDSRNSKEQFRGETLKPISLIPLECIDDWDDLGNLDTAVEERSIQTMLAVSGK